MINDYLIFQFPCNRHNLSLKFNILTTGDWYQKELQREKRKIEMRKDRLSQARRDQSNCPYQDNFSFKKGIYWKHCAFIKMILFLSTLSTFLDTLSITEYYTYNNTVYIVNIFWKKVRISQNKQQAYENKLCISRKINFPWQWTRQTGPVFQFLAKNTL